jgi:enoyl-CoA hydratase/carnithine racemase
MNGRLASYSDKYQHLAMSRDKGVLEVTLHSGGGPLIWGGRPHEELSHAFYDISRDPGNRCVLITGTGDAFCTPPPSPITEGSARKPRTSRTKWDPLYSDARHLLMNLMNIEVPVIAAINGPVTVHADIPLLADIVLASETAVIADVQHFTNLLVPGDGIHVLWPMLVGINRARYFLMTGQHIDAQEALRLGLVGEVLPQAELLDRARELAHRISDMPSTVVRASRAVLTHQIRVALQADLAYGLAAEGLAAVSLEPELWNFVREHE